MEKLIREYFRAWLDADGSRLGDFFEDGAVYSECYGPEYVGLGEISEWFFRWNARGRVLRWDIKRMINEGNVWAVEWYFSCVYDGTPSAFDGVSLIEFDADGKITGLREFESKAGHYRPYAKK